MLGAAALLAGGIAASNASVGGAASAQAAPFTPPTPTVYISQGSPTQLTEAIQGPSGVEYVTVGAATRPYNAVGFRPSDRYIYGITGSLDATPGHLVRVESNGTVTDLGTVAGLANLGSQQYNIGAFVGNTLYVTTYVTVGGAPRLFAIDVDARTATSVAMTSLTTIADFTELDGYLWGLDTSTNVVRINPTTGQTDIFPGPPGVARPGAGQGFGGAWTYGNGNLGFSDSDSGNVYQISVDGSASPTPTFTLASTVPGPPNTRNDGTSSVPTAPVDLALAKSVTPGTAETGDPVTYTLTVTNNGPGNSSGFTVNDPIPSGLSNVASDDCLVDATTVLCIGGELLAGASTTFTLTATLSSSGPSVTNTAEVLGNELDPEPSNNTSSATVAVPTPQISIEKHAGTPVDVNQDGLVNEGDTIQYTFIVTNTGGLPLTGISVTDPKVGAVTCPDDALAVGASELCSASAPYTITAADVINGSVDNTATSAGETPNGTPVISTPSTTTTPTTAAAPAITIVKTASLSTIGAADEEIIYSFEVTNTGNVPLADVTVNDVAFSGTGTLSAIDCPEDVLSVGQAQTCTATYTATQADVDAGTLTNTATATGTPPPGDGGPVTSTPSTVTIPAPPAAEITIDKHAGTPVDVNEDGLVNEGDTIQYTFTVTNTGNVTLSDIAVTDIKAGQVDCPDATLAPGDQETCTATAPYTITAADVANGSVDNTATSSGNDPSENPVISTPSTTTTPTTAAAPAITIVKTASFGNGESFAVGAVVTYSFAVTNTGNVPLNDVAVTETDFSGTGTLSAIDCPATTLAIGTAQTCTATYTVTQADVDAATLTNTAVSTGTPPGGTPVTSTPSTVTLPSTPHPSLALVKSAGTEKITAVGQTVSYSFAITNTGDVTLTDVMPAEGAFSGSGQLSMPVCPAAAASLAPGDSVTCTATYTVTAADLAHKTLTNTATAVGTDPSGTQRGSQPSTAVVKTELPASGLASTGADSLAPLPWAAGLLLGGLAIVLTGYRRRGRNELIDS